VSGMLGLSTPTRMSQTVSYSRQGGRMSIHTVAHDVAS
jgi:hypothetical protein